MRPLLLRSPLFRNLFRAVALLALAPIAATAVGAALLVRGEARDVAERLLRSDAVLAREAARPLFRADDAAGLDALAKRLARETRARFTFVAADGRVLGDSDSDPARMENHADRPEIRGAREQGIGVRLRRSDTLEKDLLYLAIPAEERGAIVRAAVPADELVDAIAGIHARIAAVAAPFAVAAIVSAALSIAAFARTVDEITTAASAVAAGGPMRRTDAELRDDELGTLARSVHEMARTLERQVRALADERDELSAVVAGLAEGLIALDPEGRVLLVNGAALAMFGLDAPPAAGTPLVDVLRQAELAALARTALETGAPAEAKLEVARGPGAERRRLEARATAYGVDPARPAGAVVLLRDITEVERYERLRRDFVANVSHELRTPLALVKGFLETLEDGAIRDPERGPRFLEILKRHVLGLERLVEDLLTLSHLEAGGDRRAPEPVSVGAAIDAVLAPFEPVFERRRLRVTRAIAPDLPPVAGQPEWVERAVRNLVDNAVKFTPEGGEIEVAARAAHGRVEIAVRDTGPGIPAEEQARVFERFYRVEKSRSREAGGTGLGLAIVKHIAQQAGGGVAVASELGKGSTFTVTFPAASSPRA